MTTTLPLSASFTVLVLIAAPLTAQPSSPAKPVFENGQAQIVDAFKDPKEWIKHDLWVEAPFDSDGDGRPDRLHVDVTRQRQTETEGLRVPVVYETSPYFSGIGSTDPNYFWNPEHELGAEPPKRNPMPPIRHGSRRPLMSRSLISDWVPRGFAVVHSASPGTGLSQGCATVGGENEALAPKTVIDWLNGRATGYTTPDGDEEVKADWCTGKVGMTGTSYNGFLPVAAATTGVEGLAAIIPVAPSVSYYRYYRSNGLVRHPGGYMGEDADVLYDFINSGDPKRRAWCDEHVRDGVMRAGIDRLTGDYNDFWSERDYLAKLDRIQAATLMAHGFNDWNVMPVQSVTVYASLRARGVPAMAYFHQDGHGGNPPGELMNRWFTRYLYGVENGVEDDPRSWIVRESDAQNDPTPYPDYPHPDAAPVSLFATGNGLAVGSLATAQTDAQGRQTLVDDVSVDGAQLAMAAESPHRLLFATAPLDRPVHLSGTPRIALRLASSKPATNLSVWLVSLPWVDGARITDNLITRGWADPQNRESLRESAPLEPGEFYDVAFDLQPDDQVIAAGQRIGLMIFASDRDFTLWPAPGTQLTIDLAGTRLDLPIVGGRAALER